MFGETSSAHLHVTVKVAVFVNMVQSLYSRWRWEEKFRNSRATLIYTPAMLCYLFAGVYFKCATFSSVIDACVCVIHHHRLRPDLILIHHFRLRPHLSFFRCPSASGKAHKFLQFFFSSFLSSTLAHIRGEMQATLRAAGAPTARIGLRGIAKMMGIGAYAAKCKPLSGNLVRYTSSESTGRASREEMGQRLDCPYKQKDEAKKLGAIWSPKGKFWCGVSYAASPDFVYAQRQGDV